MMQNTTVINNIPLRLDRAKLARKLHVKSGTADATALQHIAAEAEAVANPKAAFKVGYIDSRSDNAVVIEGTTLTSRVLRVNLDQAHRVFAYVATCGVELHDWAAGIHDMVHAYWADVIKEMALTEATRALEAEIVRRYHPGRTSTMAPGSLGDWPVEQQGPLFQILGDAPAATGVRLTESYLMIPDKSVSGIRFATEQRFESCMLCPRDRCPGRQAPYDPGLYARKYQSDNT